MKRAPALEKVKDGSALSILSALKTNEWGINGLCKDPMGWKAGLIVPSACRRGVSIRLIFGLLIIIYWAIWMFFLLKGQAFYLAREIFMASIIDI